MSLEDRSNDQDRRHRRAIRIGVAASVAGHLALFLVFGGQSLPPSPFAAAGERAREARAAQGDGLEAVELRPPEQVVVAPVPVPVPVPEPLEPEPQEPEPEVTIDEVPEVALADGLSSPGQTGPAVDRGLPDGEGAGDGGTEAEGRFRVVPPRPRGLTLPPGDRPSDVRGKEVEVWVFVSASGQVVADSTRLLPPTGDRRYDRRLREHAAAWVFEAARRDGRAVAEWFRYTISM